MVHFDASNDAMTRALTQRVLSTLILGNPFSCRVASIDENVFYECLASRLQAIDTPMSRFARDLASPH